MEQNSLLREKLTQHEFDYPENAWEKMGTLLDAATPPAPNVVAPRFPKWFKMAGAAAAVSALFFTLTSTAVHYPLEWVGVFKAESVAPAAVVAPENSSNVTEKQSENTEVKTVEKTIIPSKPLYQSLAPEEVVSQHNTSTSAIEVHKEKSKKEHAAPVDDSKVYRENKNFKNHNHIIDEKSKVPSAMDN